MRFSPTPSSRVLSSPLFAIICLFYLFSSTALAASAVLGVDLGTEYIKASLVKPGIPLDIVLTKDSRRKETSAVAFKPEKNPQSGLFPERLYGSDAVALAARFPGDVYPNLKTLLGLPADNSVVKDYSLRHPALRLETEKTRGTAAFRSGAFAQDEEPWTVEEILAMELQNVQKNAEALAGKGSVVRDLVITVPPFYTTEEKRAVLLAAELAGLRVLELISDGLAVGLNYATSRTFPSITQGGKPETHMVFDMGAGSTKATILKFQGRTVKDIGKYNKTIQEVQVLGNGWDRTLGGDSLNALIVDDMINKFVESSGGKKVSATVEAVQANGRAAAKLWKEAERLRQVLSANTNTQASFEGLHEDVDFRYKISRAEFEQMAASHKDRVGIAIQKALDSAELTIKDLDSVILHGGAIRTPFVQKELEKLVGNADKIRTNVNSDEAAAFGAGFRGAGLSPSFRVKEIRTAEAANYAAGIKWRNIHDKPQHQRLWQSTSYLGAEKQYSFKNQHDFSIDFYEHVPSSENVSPGSAEKETLKLTTQNLTESVAVLKQKYGCTDADINLKLSTRLSTSNGQVEIQKLIVDCEVEDTDKPGMVDSVKGMFGFGKKDQEPLAEEDESVETISTPESSSSETASTPTSSTSTTTSVAKSKPTKHFQVIPIKYTAEPQGRPQLPRAEIIRMKDRLEAFADSDRARRLREDALNQLEGFTYKAKDLLNNEDFIAASTDEERTNLKSKAEAAGEWIYSEGKDATREELKAKLKEMKDIVVPIETRKDEAVARPEAIKSLRESLNQTLQVIVGITGQIENDTKIRSSWSASKAAAATATPSATSNEFAGLEDDEETTTVSAPIEKETLDPPMFSNVDLVLPQTLYDTISKWLEEKLAEQEKLPVTADPVILVKDIATKTKQLQDATVDLLSRSMRKPYKNKKPAPKPKTSSSKKPKATSTKSAGAEKTLDFEGKPFVTVNPGDDMPTEEQILEWIAQQKAEGEAAEAGGAGGAAEAAEAAEEKQAEQEKPATKKHDEL
jgi:hypoxia up-regulated 1